MLKIFKGYNLLVGISTVSFGSIQGKKKKERAISFLKSLNYEASIKDIVWAEQVFGCQVHSCSFKDGGKTIKKVDALLTDIPGQILAIVSADCLSIFLFEPKIKAIGLLHGSRESLIGGIIKEAILKMKKDFGADIKNLLVAFSPHIRSCHYWLKREALEKIKKTRFKKYFIKAKGKVYFDLTALAKEELLKLGVKKENIEDPGICTFCRYKEFYSARKKEKDPFVYKEKKPRFASFFALKKPQWLNLKEKNLFENIIKKCQRIIKGGGVIVFPTDTVYGLLADPQNKKAVDKIFEIKKREKKKPLPLFVKNLKMAKSLSLIDKEKEKIIKPRWPGKFTFVLKRKPKKRIFGINKETIALRIPKYKPLNILLEKVDRPLTATSANLSSKPFCLKAKEVADQLKESQRLIDLLVSVGKLPFSRPSTIIDLTKEEEKILRK